MSSVSFGKLLDIQPRDAWPNEARDFTPWLAANIAHLAEATGIPLELTGTEVSVERFSADILARNPMDDTLVLIENQLEATDHTHLGQIMTYLAGLNAHTVVWIAPAFREPHLSAIRWLNEHTSEGFSFFAVRLRLVRIADSPFAPIFEVVEKPNDWERRLVQSRKQAEGFSDIGERRRAFWQAYLERAPQAADWGLRAVATSSVWVPVPGLASETYLSLWIGAEDCGAFIRAGRGSNGSELREQLERLAPSLETELSAPITGSSSQHFLSSRSGLGFSKPENWPSIIDWMERQRISYLAAFERHFSPRLYGTVNEIE